MRHLALIPILFVLFSLSPLAAQDTPPDTSWPVEQHCVGEPTPPPDGWTYDGTILYHGQYGIHGVRADWPTSRVLAFINRSGYHLFGDKVSPDGQWYAAAGGQVNICTTCMNMSSADILVDRLYVFDISGNHPHTFYTIPWQLWYSSGLDWYNDPSVVWMDNNQLIYPFDAPKNEGGRDEWIANPFTGETQRWAQSLDLFNFGGHSPDFSRNLEYAWTDDLSFRYEHLLDSQRNQLLKVLGARRIALLPSWLQSWSPDSQRFLLLRSIDAQTDQLLLYDRDGNRIAVLLTLPTANFNWPFDFEMKWSPDSRYIALYWGRKYDPASYYATDYTLYMIDLQRQQITDTCLVDFRDFEWSPDSKQLISDTNGLLDVTTWEHYLFSVDGVVIGWRTD